MDPSSDEQEAWLRAATQGDGDALRALLVAWEPRVRLMAAVRMCGADDDATDEVAQDVMLALTRGVPRLETPRLEVYRAYVSSTVRKQVARQFEAANRERGHRRAHPPRDLLSDSRTRTLLTSLVGAESTPSSHAVRRERTELLLDVLADLDEPHREVLTLAFFDELNSSEIATVLGIARTAAANRVMRATLALRGAYLRRLDG